MSLVFAMLLGAQSIEGCDVLRSGRTGRLLGVRVVAPSTLGTFLRAFSLGHVRQLDQGPRPGAPAGRDAPAPGPAPTSS
jgi:hypothetical protein